MGKRGMGKFAVVSAIWGSSFTLIKVAVDAGVPPVWVAFFRCLFGALTLWLLCAVGRGGVPRDRRTWGHALVVAALLNSVPFTLLAHGETLVSSVLAGALNAITPLTTLVFALLIVPDERITWTRAVGLAVGFAGVLVVLGAWEGLSGDLVAGSLACLAAITCYGAGFAYTRRFFSSGPHSATALSAVQITCATAQLAVAAPVIGGLPTWPGTTAVAALGVLGAVGTGFAYVLNLDVIRDAGPTVASTVTYVTPLWSTALGVLLLSETAGWNTVVGGAIVVAGVLLARAPSARPKGQEKAPQVVRADKPGAG
ncbi:DMT family transporter [Saccharothrix australiensis]|uniref:Drug/metabolite transporter (DMT)-like permease n=1 Tax=Saccharothrix australiensis TaxID=2072 RepID=A0A495VUV8_9PSEU|nr:DMT family transporter [Saccharothrix australiensis]RKT53139.1 drug/metabolite transporter (DMT)-like permease [Saccharothrix australiensis]